MNIGDKVIRVIGFHNSGMKLGDRGTIKLILRAPKGRTYIELIEYPGEHNIENFVKEEDHNLTYNHPTTNIVVDFGSIEPKIDWDKVVKNMSNLINQEDNRRTQQDLNELIKQRDMLSKEIEILSNTKVELGVDKLNCIKIPSTEIQLTRMGNQIKVRLIDTETSQTIAKGIAECCKDDEFNEEVGIELAYHRCIANYHNKQIKRIIHETY